MRLFILSKIFLYITSKKKLKSFLSMTEIKRQRHQCPHLLKIRPDALYQLQSNTENKVTTRRATDNAVSFSRKRHRFQI